MKLFKPIIMTTAMLMAASANVAMADDIIIDKPSFKSEDGVFNIEALQALGRVTSPIISPDKKKVLYGISYESVEQNRSNNDLYIMNIDGTENTRITKTPRSESNAVWIEGGSKIAFLYPVNGVMQMWVMNADGSNRKMISNIEKGVNGFLLSPDETKVLFISNLKSATTAQDIYPDLPKATGIVVNDLMYKHWDEWVKEIPHPFLADFNGIELSNIIDIMEGEPYEAPMKPFGGVESLAWSPDGKEIIYVSRKKTGKEYAESTNSDLYLYNIETKTTTNLTEGMMGYDTNPTYSPVT